MAHSLVDRQADIYLEFTNQCSVLSATYFTYLLFLCDVHVLYIVARARGT